ncbi:MAG: hypothetical protein IJG00_00380 [Clostridia bacterium]|nr:hypothetical protein [Clostridia bacterium]
MQENITSIMPLAIAVEATITYINQFFVDGEFCWEMLLSIVLGILISIAYEIDIPKYLNLHSRIPYLSNILTGILISRGSNYIYDLMSKIIQIN